jgi:hypothetical protein
MMILSSLLSAAAAATSAATPDINPTLANHNHKHNMNRKWILKRRPIGVFDPDLDAELVESDESEKDWNQLQDHQIVVEPELLSVDAFLRTMFDEGAYHSSLPLGETLPAIGYGTVVWAGKASGHAVGTTVRGMLRASDRAVVDGRFVQKLRRRWKMVPRRLPKSACLGLLGLTTGLTAYCGVFCVPTRPPQKGETVVVTGAAGAVGSIAVQLCQSTGATVVGIAGGERKMEYLRDTLGCDEVVDYKDTSRPLTDQIAKACPNGVDFVYDNVGGDTLDVLLDNINSKGRIVICGAISQYNGNLGSKTVQGPSNYLKLAEKGAEMKGFNVAQHTAKLPRMIAGMVYLWVRGKVALTEHVEEGLEAFPYALQKLFAGKTIGKTLVRLKSDADDG